MKITALLKELIRWARFNYYKSLAITRWKIDGKRRWVMEGTRGKMYVYSNDEIRLFNKKAKKKGMKPMDIANLMQTALYGTPAGNTGERKRK